METWARELKTLIDGSVRNRMQTATAARFIGECRRMFQLAASAEQAKAVAARASGQSAIVGDAGNYHRPTTTEICGSIAGWVEYIRQLEVFKITVKNYDGGRQYRVAQVAMPGASAMQSGGKNANHVFMPCGAQGCGPPFEYSVPVMPNYGLYAMAMYGGQQSEATQVQEGIAASGLQVNPGVSGLNVSNSEGVTPGSEVSQATS